MGIWVDSVRSAGFSLSGSHRGRGDMIQKGPTLNLRERRQLANDLFPMRLGDRALPGLWAPQVLPFPLIRVRAQPHKEPDLPPVSIVIEDNL